MTSELHDSYFHLMTIKHAISKIEWALNYYITQKSSQFESQLQLSSTGSCSRVGDRDRRDVVRKATPSRRGPREPRWSLGTREVADKMQ